MSFLTNMRADRLIADIKAAGDTDAEAARKSFEKLGTLGPSAIPRVVAALANADKRETLGYVGVLVELSDLMNIKPNFRERFKLSLCTKRIRCIYSVHY